MPLPDPAPVLIVDDDDLIRGILSRRLERLEVSVRTAASAEEALALMETIRVAALVLDLSMPGQSGLDLAEFVRLFGAHLVGVPIMIFTGAMLTQEDIALARKYSAEIYLKPEGLDALLQQVAEVASPTNQLLRMQQLTHKSGEKAGGLKEPES